MEYFTVQNYDKNAGLSKALQDSAAHPAGSTGDRAFAWRRATRKALTIAGIYAVCGFLWVALSDRMLVLLIQDTPMLMKSQTFKGWFFIAITAFLVFYLTRAALREPVLLAEKVRLGELRYRALFESIDAAVLLMRGAECVECNPATLELFGITSKDEIIGTSPLDFAPAKQPDGRDSAEVVKWNIEQALTKGLHIFEWQAFKKSGEPVFMEVRFTPYRIGDEQYFQCIAIDITERKRAEEGLRKSEALLARSQEIAHVGSWVLEVTQNRLTWSDEVYRIFGLQPREFGTTYDAFLECVHPEDRASVDAAYSGSLRDGSDGYEIEHRIIRKLSGEIRYVHEKCAHERDAGGRIVRSVGIVQDITDRKRAEEAIRESEERYRSFVHNFRGIAFRGKLDFTPIFFHGAVEEITGYTESEFVAGKQRWNKIIHEDDLPGIFTEEEKKLHSIPNFSYDREYRIVRKDGQIRWVHEIIQNVCDDSGKATMLQGAIYDITERKQLEEEILKIQKLESVGTLAGGIAHDFNNLLQGIFGYISMARMTIDRKEKSLAMLEEAEKALHHSVNLTNQLLTFSKGGQPVKQTIALHPVIENSAKFALSGSSINYRLDIKEPLFNVEADEGQVGQVIQNIVLNADQAMPAGGTVMIKAGNVHAPGPGAPLQLEEGDFVMISVQDTGVGIPEQYLAKIFDPYFTTKEKGSGLGLATSYAIIRNHGGLITVSSEPGKGTTFHIFIPASNRTLKSPARAEVPAEVRRRVLVMDDEAVVRKIAADLLRELGHDVETVEHGEKAIDAYRKMKEAGRPFDVVILDLTVRGGMGGAQAMQKLLDIDPAATVIVSSGYAENAINSSFRQHGFKAFLKKPYNIDDLRNVLNSLLN